MTSEFQIPATMRANVIRAVGAPAVLEMADVAVPEVVPGDILVKVHAVGVNPVDWKTRAGAPTPAAFGVGSAPYILGWDVSGVVVKVGGGVHRFAVGDEVFGMPWFPREAGAYAEYVAAPARHFASAPGALSHVEAAALPLAGLTALHALSEIAQVEAGQRVLIHAAGGGVGHLAVQIAKAYGCYVIGTARSAKHEWLRGLGADELIDYTTVAFETVVEPVDVVIDLVGGSDVNIRRSLTVLRPGGVLVPVAPGNFDAVRAKAAIAGVRIGPTLLVDADGHGLEQLARLADAGELRIAVEQTFPLASAAEAHLRGETDQVAGKLVLTV